MSTAYYDHLAPHYHLIYSDWEASIPRQAAVLDGVIRELAGPDARDVLDAACGIGTQSLGLAALDYTVTASDVAPAALERARLEAQQRGLNIHFLQADLRQLWSAHQRQFDVVLACDNAVPHLLTDGEILSACTQLYHCTAPGGACILSLRDYTQSERGGTQIRPRHSHETPTGRTILFDIWHFDGDCYDLTTYFVEDDGQPIVRTQVIRGGRYYCITTDTLEQLLSQAGFCDVTTIRDRFFQPLVVGRRSALAR